MTVGVKNWYLVSESKRVNKRLFAEQRADEESWVVCCSQLTIIFSFERNLIQYLWYYQEKGYSKWRNDKTWVVCCVSA